MIQEPSRLAGCPLGGAQLRVLQAAYDVGDLSDKVLASALCISPNTVKTHFRDILALLGVHCRFAAVLLAATEGWVCVQSCTAVGSERPGGLV